MHDGLIEQMEEVQLKHFWFRARSRILLGLLGDLLKPGDTVMDVGCGTGLLLSQLPADCQKAGMDSSQRALEFAGRRLGTKVELKQGYLPAQIPFAEQSLQMILMTDVLEHIEDDRQTLVELQKRLADDGHILITVPAFSFLWSRHDEEHGHYRRYRSPQLRQLLEDCGFVVERISYFNFLLFPLVLAVRLLKKITGDHGNDMAIPFRPVNSLMERIFGSEVHWLARHDFPWGVSLLAIARRPQTQPLHSKG